MSNILIKIKDVLKLEYGKGLPEEFRDINGNYGAYGANGIKTRTNKFLYDKPSIIVGRKGSAGELTLVNDKFWALDVTYYVTYDDKKSNLLYLYYALLDKNLTQYAKGIKPGLNRNDVYELFINHPPLAQQTEIISNLQSIFLEIDKATNATKDKVEKLIMLKQSILQKTFDV